MITFELKNPKEIRLAIAFKGYSLRSFAKKINISNSFLTQILNENRKVSPMTAKKIAEGLEKEIDDIFFIHSA